jgi:hypothetical protein
MIRTVISKSFHQSTPYIIAPGIILTIIQFLSYLKKQAMDTDYISIKTITLWFLIASFIIFFLFLLYYTFAALFIGSKRDYERLNNIHRFLYFHFTKFREDPENASLFIHFPLFLLPGFPIFCIIIKVITTSKLFIF